MVELDEKTKKSKIINMFSLLNGLLLSMENDKRARKVLERLQETETISKISGNKKQVSDFKIKHRSILEDVKKVEIIKNDNFSTLKLAVEDTRSIIGNVLADELLYELERQDKNGISKIDDTVSKIEDKTDVSYALDTKSVKDFTIDNYFLEMSITYGKIAKGLSRTITELEVLIDELDEQISKAENIIKEKESKTEIISTQTEAQEQKEPAKAIQESPKEEKTVVSSAPAQEQQLSLEEIELGVGYENDNVFNDLDDVPDNVEEIVEGEDVKEDLSGGIFAVMGEQAEEENEAGIKP